MIVIFDRDEPKGLEYTLGDSTERAQDFGHAVYGSGLCLECDFDEVTLGQRLRNPEQAARNGNGLKFGFGAASVLQTNGGQNGISELDPRRAPRGVRLGEVGHRLRQFDLGIAFRNRLRMAVCRLPGQVPLLPLHLEQRSELR